MKLPNENSHQVFKIRRARYARADELELYSSSTLCVYFLPIHSGHQVRWTYQPGSYRRKVTQDFSSTFFLRCVP